MKLNEKKCAACSGEIEQLTPKQIEEFLTEVIDWKLSEDKKWIYREFKFKNFKQTLEFVNKVGEIAEAEGHHPNIEFTWGYCKILIQTHKINGLSENDFILAAKIDQKIS